MKCAGEQIYAWHLPVPKPPHCHAPKGTAVPPQSCVTRLNPVPRPQRHANLDMAQQMPKLLPRRHHGWQLDLRRVTVECARCKDSFSVLAHPLFNWLSLSRIVAAVALLLLLAAVLAHGQL
jgi:hypothetical protein